MGEGATSARLNELQARIESMSAQEAEVVKRVDEVLAAISESALAQDAYNRLAQEQQKALAERIENVQSVVMTCVEGAKQELEKKGTQSSERSQLVASLQER